MDDIYDNLENYNELNVVEELRNENKEMKSKLQEYSHAMNQLQIDLDKLNSEYKKLEINYSSLLKTARAEIERKTQLITNLNKEKDRLIISSMQKGHKNILNNFNRDVYYKKETERKNSDTDLANGTLNKPGPKVLNVNEGLRCEAILAPSKYSPSNVGTLGTANRSASSENKNRNTSDKHCSDSKENISKSASVQTHKDVETKSMKITNRRKSMPVLSNADEIYSEEEVNDQGPSKHSSNRNQHYENKNYYEHNECKSYKPSQHSNYESRNNYCNKRYTDNYNPYQRETRTLELQRNADYQTRSHFKMYSRHSPERDRYKPHRIYNHSQRLDYNQRVLESPPLDKYIGSKSRERRYQERDYNVYNSKNKRNEHNSDERDYTKEPDYKRRKIESTGTDTEKNDRCIDRKTYKHSDYNSSLKHENYTSCQSPDYDQFEPTPTTQHFVKEIKHTANDQLEDPRMTSKKYLLENTDGGTFITRADKNVCMVPMYKLKWRFENVEVPEALREHPSPATLNEDLIKNIHMEIDIPSLHIEECNKNQLMDDKSHMLISSDTPEVTKHKEDTSKLKNRNDLKTQTKTLKEHYQTPKTLSLHYKIPKKSSAESQDIIKLKKKVDEDTKKDERRLEKACKVQSKDMGDVENNCSTKLKSQVQRLALTKDNIERDLELSDEASDVTDDIHIDNDKVKVNISVHDIKYKEIDNIKNKTAKENIKVDESRNKIYNQASNKDAINIIEKFENNISAAICKEQITKKGDEIKDTLSPIETIEINTEDSKSCSRKCKEEKKVTNPKKNEECKNKKSKKKFQEEATELNECKVSKSRIKRKRISKVDTHKSLQESQVHSENLDSSTKTQPKDYETKNKFTELFGESSSLITPHDLGVSTKLDINAPRNDKYGSLFENTQDAIDLNVRDIQEKLNTEENTKDPLCSESVASENVPLKISSYIDKKAIFQIEDEHSANSIFKNLKPADSENESHIVKTVIISSGTQPYIEENMHKKDLPEIECNDEMVKVADKQLSLELLKAVATSTPHKMDLEFPSRLSEISHVPNNESVTKNDDITVLNTSSTSTIATESNAPDVRIFLKRRRKIKKT